MTDLHARFLVAIDDLGRHLVGCVSCTTCEASALTQVARAVLELHAPTPYYEADPTSLPVCRGCELDGYDAEHPPWPCWTVKAVAEALGVAL